MPRIELPSGGWIDLRDPETIRAGDQDDILRRIGKIDKDKPLWFGLDIATGLKLLMIADWKISYLSDPEALPVANPKLLRELTLPDNRALETALAPARELLFPTPVSVDDEQLDDPASPTTPASG